LRQNIKVEAQSEASTTLDFLLSQGLGEATDVLLIDKALCVNCDNCEIACAATHGGTSRLDRQAGSVFAEIHVPTSCRHCEDPHCMKDCPPDAIRRSPGGEVYIADNCIGCGNCEANCPYDVIQMAAPAEKKRGFWTELLLGPINLVSDGPKSSNADPALKKAVKCDMCKDLAGGPACVRACPTGAADRVSPQTFVELVTARSK
ncbi:MAG: 4Fe-4S dicluster domain-containing protein, partial [Gammaproteobacteria bacterium]